MVPPGYAAFAWQVHCLHARHVWTRHPGEPSDQLGLKIIDALDPRDNLVPGDPFGNVPPRYNGAPSQQLWVIRQNPQTGERSLDLLQWGLIPYWCQDKPKPPPINAKAETSIGCLCSVRHIASAGASCRSTASSSAWRSKARR